MKSLILMVALGSSLSVHATNWQPPSPAPTYPSANASANAGANAQAGSLYNMPKTEAYGVSFSAPALAAALPGYLCPKGDSLSWSILWGAFSMSTSTTRTEMECLDKLVSIMAQARAAEPRLPLTLNVNPPAPVNQSVVSSCSYPSPATPVKKIKRKAKVCP